MKSFIIIGFIMYLTLISCNQNSNGNNQLNNDLSNLIGKNDQSTAVNYFSNIKIKKEISDEVDSSKVFRIFGLSEDVKTKIKKILSDPNPDPDNKSGTACGEVEKKCKWCSNTFTQNKKTITAQETLKLYLSGFYELWVGMTQVLMPEEKKTEERNRIEQICNNFQNGDKYICEVIDNESEFCSLKCENEYKNSR